MKLSAEMQTVFLSKTSNIPIDYFYKTGYTRSVASDYGGVWNGATKNAKHKV